MPPTKKTTSKTTTDHSVENPVMTSNQITEARDQRLVTAALILSGMYANPCNGNQWHVTFFDWVKSLFGFHNRTASSMSDYKHMSHHAMNAANELIHLNETTPL